MKRIFYIILHVVAYLWSYIYTLNMELKWDWICRCWSYYRIKRYFYNMGKVYIQSHARFHHPEFISICDGSVIGCRALVCAHPSSKSKQPLIEIGQNCNIGDDCNIQCCNHIKFGNGVRLGRKVMINDTSHGEFVREQLDIQPNLRPLVSKGPIIIDDNVWIGEMVCILGNVHIGKGSVIGAGTVVTKDIPEYSLAVGVPAKVIKTFSDMKEKENLIPVGGGGKGDYYPK